MKSVIMLYLIGTFLAGAARCYDEFPVPDHADAGEGASDVSSPGASARCSTRC